VTSKPETRFIARVHKGLGDVYFEKTNNPYRRGMPDVYYEGPSGAILWVEYKWYNKLPALLDLQRVLSPLQQHWLRRAHNNQVNVAVVVGSPDGAVIAQGSRWETKLTPKPMPLSKVQEWIRHQLIL
jgi:hypothetical protein